MYTLTSMLHLSLTFISIVLLYLFLTRRRRRWAGNLPPGPAPLPIIGNLLDLGNNPHKSLAELSKIHGPIMSLRLGQITSVIVSSATMAKEILLTHDLVLSDRFIPSSLEVYNHNRIGLPWIPATTPLWKNLRKICKTELFATKILDNNQILRRTKVRELVNEVRRSAINGEPVDIGKTVMVTSFNLLSSTIFTVDLTDDPRSQFAEELKKTARGIMEEAGKPNLADYFPFLKVIDIQSRKRRMKYHMGKIFDMLDRLINQRLELQKTHDGSSLPDNDVAHYLLKISEDDSDSTIGKTEILHLILVFFIAGTETTSASLEWAMAELLRNPEKMSKTKAELDSVIGKNNPVEESDIDRLPYLQAVAKEVLRLHPPVPLLLPRKARADTKIAEFIIPKDSQILVNVWAIGRDPKLWENPDSFLPERFLDSDIDVGGKSFELLPFGGGRRICPGLPLAMRMLHLMLASLVHLFDWKLEDGVEPEAMNMAEKFGLTLEMAHPLRAMPSSSFNNISI